MARIKLTFKSVRARPVLVPLKRPVVSRVGLFHHWPIILIDLYTNEGIVGHSYLEPYLKHAARYIVPAILDLAEAVPLQLGENFYGPRLLYQAVLAAAGDYVMPDMMRIGGVTGWLRAGAITSAAGTPMSTHLYPEISAHVMRVTDRRTGSNGRTGPTRYWWNRSKLRMGF